MQTAFFRKSHNVRAVSVADAFPHALADAAVHDVPVCDGLEARARGGELSGGFHDVSQGVHAAVHVLQPVVRVLLERAISDVLPV